MTMLTPISNDHLTAGDEPRREAQMLAFSELPDGMPAAGANILDGINPLHQIKTRLTVAVGEVEMTVGELLAAREHQVVRLNRSIDQPVDLLLGGQVVARGQLVAVEEQFAIRITELPLPLKV